MEKETEKVKFTPQKPVEWYAVKQLSKTAVKAVISSVFGTFSDKREIQAALDHDKEPFDFSHDKDNFWIDYVADLGEGFQSTYTIATQLAAPHLEVSGKLQNGDNNVTPFNLRRGNVLIMGGDQVYPTASREDYLNRLKGPYEHAFPWDGKDNPKAPTIFAIPGNHDWYDGLTNFLKTFCQKRWIGGWQTKQRRSYFALKLPHKVWLFGIDIQLNSDIDENQKRYFEWIRDNKIEDGSKIIVCTAEPSWIFKTRRRDIGYNNLQYFEKEFANCDDPKKKISQILTLAGDLHHYSRYRAEDGSQKITSGGGGAFLHPTHNLPDEIPALREGNATREAEYPSGNLSRAMSTGNLAFTVFNLGFSTFTAGLYFVTGWLLHASLFGEVMESQTYQLSAPADIPFRYFLQDLAFNPVMFVISVMMIWGLYAFGDKNPYNPGLPTAFYKVNAFVHGLVQVFFLLFFYWVTEQIIHDNDFDDFIAGTIAVSLAMLVLGFFVSPFLMGLYLWFSNFVLGNHDNEAFSSLKIMGYKHFIRMKLTENELTIYPVKVEETVKWKYNAHLDKFYHTGPAPVAELIEAPIIIPLKKKREGVHKHMLKIRLSRPVARMKQSYDVLVIGSGYGGSIAASRMARAGKSVCLFEKGKEFRPGEYPNSFKQAKKEIHVDDGKHELGNRSNLYQFNVNNDISVFHGCGLGGTSLVNANVSLPPEKWVLDDPAWPSAFQSDLNSFWKGMDLATDVLQPTAYPVNDPYYGELPKTMAHEKSAAMVGGKFTLTPVNVRFTDGANSVGFDQKKCNKCGDCVTGCNHGAKNTTLMNYLPDAVNHGAEIYTETEVTHLSQAADGKWQVYYRMIGEGHGKSDGSDTFVTASMVFLGAGALGSTKILLASAAKGLSLSSNVGKKFTGNGDVLGFSYNSDQLIDGIGAGKNQNVKTPIAPGPCITSVIDLRDQQDDQGMVIEEGVMPGALAPMVRKAFLSLARFMGKDTDKGWPDYLAERRREIVSLFKGPYQGAIRNTQTYLVMAHDDGNGELFLEKDHIRIKWPDLGRQQIFKKIQANLLKAATALGGEYLKNPSWTRLMDYSLVTVHPLGGCVMANTAADGVVNHKGQVFNGRNSGEVYPNLIVCDGSIIPRPLGVNPLLTISALAERSCQLIADEFNWKIDYRKKPMTLQQSGDMPGIAFTETMRGFISAANPKDIDYAAAYEKGKHSENACSFTLTIAAEDVNALIEHKDHLAQTSGTVDCKALSPEPLTVRDGKFNLFVADDTQAEVIKMLYEMQLHAQDGSSYYFKGYKQIQNNKGLDMWADTTTLFVDIWNGNSPTGDPAYRGILRIRIDDFKKQLGTIRVTHAKSKEEEAKCLLAFIRFFTNNLWDAYGNVFLSSMELHDADAPPRSPRPLACPKPSFHTFKAKDGLDLRLTRFNGGNGRAVMLIHGLGVSSKIFTIDTIAVNLTEALCKAGYDVWLIDNRLSIDLEYAHMPFTGDDVAENDYQPAIDFIRKSTGLPAIDVVAHCFGSTTFCMSLLGGLEGVRSAVLSQAGPHVLASKMNVLKSTLRIPQIFEKVGIQTLTARTDSNAKWKEKVFNRMLTLVPNTVENKTSNAVSNRITFLYGPLYEKARLNDATFDALYEMFDLANIEAFKHLAEIINQEKIVNAKGEDVYLPFLASRMRMPITFIHGAENACFKPEGTKKTEMLLSKYNPQIEYRHHVVPGYGHIDCIIGAEAAKDIFELVIKHLKRCG